MNSLIYFLWGTKSLLLGLYLGVAFQNHGIGIRLAFKDTAKLFSSQQWLNESTFSAMCKHSSCSIFVPTYDIVRLVKFSHSGDCVWYLTAILLRLLFLPHFPLYLSLSHPASLLILFLFLLLLALIYIFLISN